MRKENGITLIALVITIIVLLILAGVTIAMLSGDNGLLTRAQDTKANQAIAGAKDEVALAYNDALSDYLAAQLIVLIMPGVNQVVVTIVSTLVGFIVGVVVNYFISTYWVYQNVDKDVKTKSKRFITWFVILSLIAMLLSIGTMLLCDLVVTKAMQLDSIVEVSIISLIKNYGISFLSQVNFWTYFVSFVLKTLVGLVWNYFTRKYLLYKEPKTN